MATVTFGIPLPSGVNTVRDQLQRTLGSAYVLDREIGRGGMATVYLARDVKHDRRVALKVLDPELGAVLGAERFLSEIRVTANLQHPNLLPLFDSGEADGLLYYVMPFVEGESLRHRLEREKQLPVEEAVRIAVAVANALDYAHQHGVIHRDLKPENILLQHGQPVVADFGIALAVSNAGGARVTQTGLSLGTPQYMSPEQATGDRAIDGRTDIYSLGAVAYEMLAGEPPHSGTSAQAIIAKLMTTEPQPVRTLRQSVPANVAMAVEHALAKLPADRFDSAKALAEALANPHFTTAMQSVASTPVARPRRAVELSVGAVAAVSIAAAVWAWTRPTPVLSAARYNIDLDSSEALIQSGRWGRVAISPDGSTIVYVGGPKNALMLRRRDRLNATQIPGTEQSGAPFFSPDGKHVGFYQNAARLMTVGLDGSPPIVVTDSLIGFSGGTWGSDGNIYSDGSGQTPLVRVAARSGAKPQRFTALDTAAGERDQILPSALPDGKSVLFTAEIRPRDGGPTRYAVQIADVRSGEHRLLLDNALIAQYAAPGYLVYVTATRAAMAVPFNVRTGAISGTAVQLAQGFGVDLSSLAIAVSQTGTLMYVTGPRSAAADRELVWVGRDGHATPIDSSWRGVFAEPAISPDGKWVAVTSSVTSSDLATNQLNARTLGGVGDIWVRRLSDGVITKLTLEGSANRFPVWSADSKSVLYVGGGNGQSIYQKEVAGGTPPVIRVSADQPIGQFAETSDGQWIVYQQGVGAGNVHLFARRREDTASVSLFKGVATRRPAASPDGSATTRLPALSPDGKWLAYVSSETGGNEVFVVPFPNVTSAKWQVSRDGGDDPHWSNRGDELIYRSSSLFLMTVPVSTKPTFSIGTPKQLPIQSASPGNPAPGKYLRSYAIEHDDSRFLMVRRTSVDGGDRLSVFENWPSTIPKK